MDGVSVVSTHQIQSYGIMYYHSPFKGEVNLFIGGCFWVVAGVHSLVKFHRGWA